MANTYSYTLTRIDENDEETTYDLEIEVDYEPPDYEDGYTTNGGGGWYMDGGAFHNGKPFALTDDEREEISSYIASHSSKISRDMEPEPDLPDLNDYDAWR